jgi:flagellar basal-body rod protein FlgG
MRALQIASTGMMAQQTNVEVISNNIANMSTTGYKRRRAEFQDLLYQNMRRVGSQSSENGSILPAGAQVGLGVKTAAIYRIGEQGSLSQTDNRFDIAIRGNGFFQVQMPSGETGYTRDGTFGLSAEGQLVTAEGFLVLPAVTIPAAAVDVTINATGEVLAKLDGQVAPANVGQLQTAIFANEGGLKRSATIPCWRPRPRARRSSPRRGSRGMARCCRASSRPATSTWCRRSPSSSPRSAPMR